MQHGSKHKEKFDGNNKDKLGGKTGLKQVQGGKITEVKKYGMDKVMETLKMMNVKL